MATRLLEKTPQEKKQELRLAWRLLRKSGHSPEEIFRGFSIDKKMPLNISFEGNRSIDRMEIVLSEGKFGEKLVLEGNRLYCITKCFYGMGLIREIPTKDAREIAFQLPTASDMPVVKSRAGDISKGSTSISDEKRAARISEAVDAELDGKNADALPSKNAGVPAGQDGKSKNKKVPAGREGKSTIARFKERMSDFFSKKEGTDS